MKKSMKVMSSSKTDNWATPQELYDELDKEFSFTLDPCADSSNAKCKKYFTKEQNGLIQDWSGERVFLNPPYGRQIKHWIKKAYEQVHYGDCICCVMLIPARTDTSWFHEFIYGRSEMRFIRGRLRFGTSKHNAPFPSMIVIFKK